MKKIYENGLLIFILLVTVFFSWRSFAREVTSSCSIKKIYNHCSNRNSPHDIEVGNLVLYFDTVPQLIAQPTVEIKNGKETQAFFLPGASIHSDEVKRAIERIAKEQNNTYGIVVSQVQTPQRGVRIVISYPQGIYAIDCKRFEAITRDKGLVFTVYNQKTLNALRTRQEPMVQTVFSGRHPPHIFIDNGHGGVDTGAIGHDNIEEKNICLAVGKELALLLKKRGCIVTLSRSDDQDIRLDQRTTQANNVHADMLISIHANSSTNSSAHGIETFYMQPSLFNSVNIPSFDNVGLSAIHKKRSEESYALARYIQNNICNEVASYQSPGFNRGVKYAVAQVFFVRMPAILVELGFLTNRAESNLLINKQYQHALASAMYQGICDYFKLPKLLLRSSLK